MISFIQVIDVLKTFSVNHWQLQKFDFDFREQMPNFATIDEAYPILYVVPVGTVNVQFSKEFELDIYCVDRYKKDRSNVDYVISDTELILSDVSVYLENQTAFDSSYGNTTPINNDLLDYAGGHVMRIRVTVEKQALCEIPFDGEQPTPPTCPSALVRNSDGSWSEIVASGATYILPDTPVNVRNVSGDDVGSGDVPSVTGGVVTVPNCPVSGDGTAVLKDTDGNILSTTQVAPETTVDITAPDANYLVEYEDGTPIESGSIVSGGSKVIEVPNPIVCADTTLQINGVNEGSFASGSTIDLQLTDGTNPVVPDSVEVVGQVVTATLPAASTGWVRNPDWIPLPEITSADNRFVGLFLVFENEYNQTTVQATNLAANIDWGDGSSVVSNGAVQTHVYDYATIGGAVKQYYDGRNYKQVIVDVTETGVGTINLFYIDRNNGINNGGSNNYGDISCSFPDANFLLFSNVRFLHICERFALYNCVNNISFVNCMQRMTSLRNLDFPWDKASSLQNMLRYSGNGLVIGEINTPATVLAGLFQDTNLESVGSIVAPNASNGISLFNNSRVQRVGDITLASATGIQSMFQSSYIVSVGVISVPIATDWSNIFNGTKMTGKLIFTHATFSGIPQLQNQSFTKVISPLITTGFTVANNNLTSQALNDLFTSLGMASGSQTIIVTGNPGAATCDTTIATAKGFTVTI